MISVKANTRNIISAFIMPTFVLLSGCSSNVQSSPVINNKILNKEKAQVLVDKFVKPYGSTATIAGVVQNDGASVAESKVHLNNFTDNQYGTYSGPGVAAFVKYNDDTWALVRLTITPPDNILGSRWYDTNIKE